MNCASEHVFCRHQVLVLAGSTRPLLADWLDVTQGSTCQNEASNTDDNVQKVVVDGCVGRPSQAYILFSKPCLEFI